MTLPDAASHAIACENCHAPLQGEFCYQCGQSSHNPLRHAGHALEEVFESFWHLDGRIFRTLRTLMSPGRLAMAYLGGHRAPFVAPLRLFVILSVLTFFIGKLTVHLGDSDSFVNVDSGLRNGQTIEEVERERDRQLAELESARKSAAQNPIPGVDAALLTAQVRIRGEAANRIAEIRNAQPGPAGDAPAPLADTESGSTDSAAGNPTTPASTAPGAGDPSSADSRSWNPDTNPVKVGWLPDFANRWINRKLATGQDNIKRMQGQQDLYLQAFMTSLPSALFVLVPVFALLLKLAYLFKRRLYLEHMVVALYSHCFLLIALTGVFLLSGIGHALGTAPVWLQSLLSLTRLAIFLWMPFYLLLMQKRVYGQGWPMTLLKYLVIGNIYFFLLTIAATVMFLATLAKTI